MDPESPIPEEVSVMVHVRKAAHLVRFGFIMQPSISYLDLQLSKNSQYYPTGFFSRARHESYVNTEERYLKFCIADIGILYKLHLDSTKERDLNFNETLTFGCSTFSKSQHGCKLELMTYLPFQILVTLLQAANDRNVPTIKMLKMVMENHSSKRPLLSWLPDQYKKQFVDFFYPRIPDSKVFKDFIRRLEIEKWVATKEGPEKLKYLLCCAKMIGNEGLDGPHFKPDELVGRSIMASNYENVGIALKYVCTTTTDRECHEDYIECFRPRFTYTYINNVLKWMTKKRVRRVLQMIRIYLASLLNGNSGTAAEALGLVWKSIPDPNVTYRELKDGFGGALLEGEVDLVHDFYKQVVGDPCENLEPRSLKHLCRTTLRRAICKSKLWIPEGIMRLPLPKSLQLYLNLDQPLSI